MKCSSSPTWWRSSSGSTVASHRLAPDMVEVRLVRPLSDQVDEAAERLTIVQTLRDWCSLHPGVRADIVH